MFSEEPSIDPDLSPDQTWGGFNVGTWGYQVLREKAIKIKKNPIGFALPDDTSCDGQNISPNQTEDSNKT